VAVDLQPASFLIKPLHSPDSTPRWWLRSIQRTQSLRSRPGSKSWRSASDPGKIVFAAILQIMRGHGHVETDAFALIRQTAMRLARRSRFLSAEIIAAVNAEPDDAHRIAIVALKIIDTLPHRPRHAGPGGGERARQIDGPASASTSTVSKPSRRASTAE